MKFLCEYFSFFPDVHVHSPSFLVSEENRQIVTAFSFFLFSNSKVHEHEMK